MPSRSVPVLLLAVLLAACLTACGKPRPPRTAAPSRPAAAVAPSGLPQRVALARSLIGSPYRFGGDTPAGFDCSGFARYVFARDGIGLPRLARDQALAGRWVPLDEVGVGDLVFFSEVGDKPHHVGLVVSRPGQPLRMVHASTSEGVVETDVFASAYWRRRLRFARRVEAPAGGAVDPGRRRDRTEGREPSTRLHGLSRRRGAPAARVGEGS